MADHEVDGFYSLRRYMREPVPEIFQAAHLLDRAVGAHLVGDYNSASHLIRSANMPSVRAWTESLWGAKKANPEQASYLRLRPVQAATPILDKSHRLPVRMPTRQEKDLLIERYGRNCVFCGIPLIRTEIRDAIKRCYPEALPWENRNPDQHAAFQCMWMQYDHLVPHSRGGDSSIENVVLTCAPCNYARWHWTIEEVGLHDPRKFPVHKTSWDGLERFKTRGL